ncbi:hypothetical protein FRC12_001247 [Ceratobasidium sp. 428]|nr:hypothetical protein FRC12_001247 [Ceratobasidium sp. 428]
MSTRTGIFWTRDPTQEVPQNKCKDARFMWIEPVSQNLIKGQLEEFANAAGAESVRIPAYGFGTWEADGLARDSERIVMHFHGGTYIHGTAHPEDATSNISRHLLKWGQSIGFSRTLSIDYRICSTTPFATGPPTTFASPFLDALAGYTHLTHKLNFKPQNIIIAGDSAGAHLALALVRYLRDSPDLGLSVPGGLLLFSPWADPMGTQYEFGSGRGPANSGTCDFIDFWSKSDYSVGVYAKKALFSRIGLTPEEASRNPYVTPASVKFKAKELDGLFTEFPPTYIVGGDAESLVNEIRILAHRMSNDMPEGTVMYEEVADAIHDFILFPSWEPERSSTFKRIIGWISRL